jgi:RNA polymerase sigma-70 factor (sigma-E family)
MMGGVADREAVEGLDEPVLARLFRSHHLHLVRIAFLLLGSRDDAEEAVQEAYFRVERAVQRCDSVEVALPYVRTAVLNVCRSGLRRRMVARRAPGDRSLHSASAEDRVVALDEGAAVVDALRRLPARQRECLVLRHYADLSEAEIASTLGISAGSVKTHAHRGLAGLAHLLEER